MAKVMLASQLARWLPADAGAGEPVFDCAGTSVREVLDALFILQPSLRGYVLDEHGRIRRHVALFVDGSALSHRSDLGEAVGERSEIHILQALSGG